MQKAPVKKLLNAQRSVSHANGESDLEVFLQDADGRTIYLLLENKIDAPFQPRQAERYQERSEIYQQESQCRIAQTVLVAPEQYFGSDTSLEGFDAGVTYEEIRDWFNHQKQEERHRYKVALLTAAIEKRTAGYSPEEDAAVTDFWYQYWQLSQAQSSVLNMGKPGLKPAGSGFVSFKAASLPAGVELIHKLPHGNVDLQFRSMGHQLDRLKQQFEDYVAPDMSFERASKAGSIRLRVPLINTADEFEAQRQASLQGIEAAQRLLDCYESYAASPAALKTA